MEASLFYNGVGETTDRRFHVEKKTLFSIKKTDRHTYMRTRTHKEQQWDRGESLSFTHSTVPGNLATLGPL